MTNTIKGKVPMTLTLEFEGTEEELISIAEYQNEEPLDSRDLGDAMGVFLTLTMMEGGEFTCSMPGVEGLVQCTIDTDLFQWEGVKD
jgi:hypothetical protein